MISDSFPSKENILSRIDSDEDETVPEQSIEQNTDEFISSENDAIESERDDSSQVEESYADNDSSNSVEKIIEMFPERITMNEMVVEEEQSKLDGTIFRSENDVNSGESAKRSESTEELKENKIGNLLIIIFCFKDVDMYILTVLT